MAVNQLLHWLCRCIHAIGEHFEHFKLCPPQADIGCVTCVRNCSSQIVLFKFPYLIKGTVYFDETECVCLICASLHVYKIYFKSMQVHRCHCSLFRDEPLVFWTQCRIKAKVTPQTTYIYSLLTKAYSWDLIAISWLVDKRNKYADKSPTTVYRPWHKRRNRRLTARHSSRF